MVFKQHYNWCCEVYSQFWHTCYLNELELKINKKSMGLCGVTFVSVYEISCADSFLELYKILASEEVISSPISFF